MNNEKGIPLCYLLYKCLRLSWSNREHASVCMEQDNVLYFDTDVFLYTNICMCVVTAPQRSSLTETISVYCYLVC